MAGGPDLFVICKNCQAEVSPYITECPYCGHRLRKRAPKLEKGGTPKASKRERERAKRRAPRAPSLGRLRPGEMPGLRTDGRPVATIALVVVAAIVTLLGRALVFNPLDVVVGPGDEPYRLVTALFQYVSTGYEVVTLFAVMLFGWLLERRHGWWAPLLIFFMGGVAGLAVVRAVDESVIASGANGAALALLSAWAMRDMLARRRGEETESDLLGVVVIAIVLVLAPAASYEAHSLAGGTGGVLGLILGVPLARMRER